MKKLLATAILASLAFGVQAKEGPLVSMTVQGDRGNTQEFNARGTTYVAGEPNERYSVVLRNNTRERVLVVLSVDGVNAITGQTAGSSQQGYVLGPYERTEVSGWRKSMQGVARFYFTSLPDSYAARTGRPDNVGVIGVAVFKERRPQYNTRGITAPQSREAASDSAGMRTQSMGTGHGEWEQEQAYQTTFVRQSTRPQQVMQIRYDSFRNLERMGILPRNWNTRNPNRGPQAFPGEFVPDPPRNRY